METNKTLEALFLAYLEKAGTIDVKKIEADFATSAQSSNGKAEVFKLIDKYERKGLIVRTNTVTGPVWTLSADMQYLLSVDQMAQRRWIRKRKRWAFFSFLFAALIMGALLYILMKGR